MKTIFVISIMLMLSGCGNTWVERKIIQTKEERDCVKLVLTDISKLTSLHLSGSDQDFEDTIDSVHGSAMNGCVESRLYEFDTFNQSYTGRWKPFTKM